MADKQAILEAVRRGLITKEQAQERLLAMQTAAAEPAAEPVEQVAEQPIDREIGAVASQATAGVTDILGLPVDAVAGALKYAGIISPDAEPIGGSESIKNFISALGGAVDVQPQTQVGQVAGEAARMAGAGGPFSARNIATQGARAVPEIGSLLASSIGAQAGIETARQVAPDNAGAEFAAGLVGGMAPSAINAGVQGAIRRGLRGSDAQTMQQNVARAESLGVQPTLADVAEGGGARQVQQILTRTPGGRRIINSIAETEKQVAATVRQATGSGASQERAGRAIQEGITGKGGFLERFNDRASNLYDDIRIGDNAPVSVDNTKAVFSEMVAPIQGLERTSERLVNPKVKGLAESFIADLGDNSIAPYSAIKRLRSEVGRQLSGGNIVDDLPRAELKKIYAGLSADLENAAASAGQLKEFQRANNFYKSGIKRVDDQLKNIVNKAEPEKVYKAALSGAADGPNRLRAIRKSLKPEEWATVSKTQLARLGRPKSGQAGVDEGFSINTFLTNYNKLDPESRKVLFSGVKGLNQSVDDIARVVEGMKAARSAGANPSGSAGGIADSAVGVAFVSGFFEPSIAVAAGGGMLGANYTARLFESPEFIKWLGTATKMKPNQMPGHIARLSVIAKQNPDIAQDIDQYLKDLTNDN